MKKNAPLVVTLPKHLTEKRLWNHLRLEFSINREDGKHENLESLVINNKKYKKDDIENRCLKYDWSDVVYFDDSCLLQLMIMQQMILDEGIISTHFDKEKFNCSEIIKKQLLLTGYFTQWVSPLFKTSKKEKYLLSTLNFIDIGDSLQTQHEILPIIVSHGLRSLSNNSPESDVINYFEQNVSMNVFANQKSGRKKRILIENGEFRHVILRQCRKNIVEHSHSTLSFSMARLIHTNVFKRIWGINFESLENVIEKEMYSLLLNNRDTPILSVNTIDNGIGIVKSLEKTWEKSFWQDEQKKVDEKHKCRNEIETNPNFKSYSQQKKILEFALSPVGSSKPDNIRSLEKPGLNKVDEITKNEFGMLEITSSHHRIIHSPNNDINSESFSPFNIGTMIKNLIPLREKNVADEKTSHFRINKTIQPDKPNEIVNIKDSWEEFINEEPEPRIIKIITRIEKNILQKVKNTPNIKYILLNWANVSWDEHDLSMFLSRIQNLTIENGGILRPIIHINVPHHYFLFATEALAEYSREPKRLTLCFFDDTEQIDWMGLPKDPQERIIIKENFNDYLTNKSHGYITLKDKAKKEYSLLNRYLNSKPEFFEEIVISNPDGSKSFTGRYILQINLEQIKSKISYTFTSELKSILNSKFCRLTPSLLKAKNGVKSKKQRDGLIRLPNGLLVDTFFRCDGLLNNPNRKFQEKLVKELIESAIQIENISSKKIDIIISCTSPTHWFVHQIADGLTSKNRHCAHFVAKRHTFFETELNETNIPDNLNALIFTDVLSTGRVAETMINALKEKQFKILGIVALLDTRSDKERKKYTFLDAEIPAEKQMILARDSNVKKWPKSMKKADWFIDAETLEPKPIKKEDEEDDIFNKYFSGIGALAFSGKDARTILKNSDALQSGHLKHGSHHSEYVCDIKKMLGLPSLRSQIGNRLNLYLEKCDFDLIIYPNNSNAYLLLNILREIRGTPAKEIPDIVALCRFIAGEKTYSLSLDEGLDVKKIKKILIIDDGIVTGTSLKSIISAVLKKILSKNKTSLKEIHIAVFLNEMSPVKTNFWNNLGGCDPNIFFDREIIKKTTQKRGFVNPDVFFNAFLSYPHSVYESNNCPFCLIEKKHIDNSLDEAKTPFERAFYKNWANDLKLNDIYHGTINNFGKKPNYLEDESYILKKETSRSIIEILEFNILLQKEINLDSLIGKTSYEQGGITLSKIEFFKSLLRVRKTALLKDQERQTIRNLIDQIRFSDYNQTLSLLKVLIEENKPYNRLKINDFLDIIMWSKKHLKEVEIVGGIIAYARDSFRTKDKYSIDDNNKVNHFLTKHATSTEGIEKKNLEVIREFLIDGEYSRLGDNLIILRDIAFAKIGHKYLEDATRNMKGKLKKCLENISSKESFRDLRNNCYNFKQRSQKMEQAIKVVSNKTTIFSKDENDENDEFFQNFNTKISPLLEKKLFEIESKEAILKEAMDSLNGWHSKLFIPPSALLNKILDRYLHRIQDIITLAKKDAENDFHTDIRRSDYEIHTNHKSTEIEKVKIFCDDVLIGKVMKDIMTNFGKHVVKKLKSKGSVPILKFIFRKKPAKQEIEIVIQDNGEGIPKESLKKLYKNFSEINEYGCAFDISNSSQGATIALKMFYKEG